MNSSTTPIGKIAQIRAGYQTRKGIDSLPEGDHHLIQLRDFDNARTELDTRHLARIQPGAINPDQVIRDGDLLFLSKGARNFAFVPTDLPAPALAASYFFLLRPEGRVESRYLAWFLNLKSTRCLLSRMSSTSAHMPVVRRDVLADLEIPLPDLETQRKIVALADLTDHQADLLADLAAKKRMLATAACLRAANQSHTY